MTDVITIESFSYGDGHGEKFNHFVRHGRKRPDAWFIRYTLGNEPPRYQVPAIPLKIIYCSDGVEIYDNTLENEGTYIFYGT